MRMINLLFAIAVLIPSTLTGQGTRESGRDRFSAVLQFGASVGGPASGLADALREAGYDDPSPCFFFCSGTSPHPATTKAGVAGGFTIRYPIQEAVSVGAGFTQAGLGGATGYRREGFDFIFSRWNVSVAWAGVFWIPEPGFRLGAGPAWCRLDDDDLDDHTFSRFGLLGEAGFEYPLSRTFFVDLAARGNLIPTKDVEYPTPDESAVVTLRPTWTHVQLQVGLGFHL